MEQAFYRVTAYYLVALWIQVVYATSRSLAKDDGCSWKRFLTSFCFAAALSVMVGGNAGTHIQDGDPIFGGGDRVTDYAASSSDRMHLALTVFLLTYPPLLAGLLNGRKLHVPTIVRDIAASADRVRG